MLMDAEMASVNFVTPFWGNYNSLMEQLKVYPSTEYYG